MSTHIGDLPDGAEELEAGELPEADALEVDDDGHRRLGPRVHHLDHILCTHP